MIALGGSENYFGILIIWSVQKQKIIKLLRIPNHMVYTVSFSPDDKTLASGSSDATIKLWNLETFAEIKTLSGHGGVVYSVSLSPDSQTLASGSSDNMINLWNINDKHNM